MKGHLGFHISQIWVDSEKSLQGGRENWAVPKKLASFEWDVMDKQHTVAVKLAGATQPFFKARFTPSKLHISASSVLVPRPLKCILQAESQHKFLQTEVKAAGHLRLVTAVRATTNGSEVPADDQLGIWRMGLSLSNFKGQFMAPTAVHV